jgi:hypothetical protein
MRQRGLGALVAIAAASSMAAVARRAEAQCTGDPVTYRGGALLQHVRVVTVFWGAQANPLKSKLEDFYNAITASAYFDWLIEYDQPPYRIGRGSWVMSHQLSNPANTSTSVADSDIQSELRHLVDAGTLEHDPDTLFMVYFPPNFSITDYAGNQSCAVFCGYHSSDAASHPSSPIRYGVIPDLENFGCRGSCGASNALGNLTTISSHEMLEAVTDPDVPHTLSWYADRCGEIGDECNGIQATVAGQTVQLEWSNAANKCIATNPSIAPPNDFAIALSPASATATASVSATVNVATTVVSGSAEAITLNASGLPSGATGSFALNPIPSGAATVLTVGIAASLLPGSYPFKVIGTDGTGQSRQVTGTLTVAPPPDLANGGSHHEGSDLGLGTPTRRRDSASGCCLAGGPVSGDWALAQAIALALYFSRRCLRMRRE